MIEYVSLNGLKIIFLREIVKYKEAHIKKVRLTPITSHEKRNVYWSIAKITSEDNLKWIVKYLKQYDKDEIPIKFITVLKVQFLEKLLKDNRHHLYKKILELYLESYKPNINRNTPEIIIENIKEFYPEAIEFVKELEGI